MQTEQVVAADPGQVVRSNRLSPQKGEVIDRSSTIRFFFEGKAYAAHPGDTIASALAAADVSVLSRSFKYHRPRGLLCCAGHCPNCLVQVGDEPNVRSCQRRVEADMDVRPQNAWPSLSHDLLSLVQLGTRFMPAGFYYKTFIRPRSMWPLYERVLRHAAGLGEVDLRSTPGKFDKEYLYGDVAVIGGGPAGMGAALAAAEQGARVLLFDENPSLGGHLRFAPWDTASGTLSDLLAALDGQPNIAVYTDTAVLGWYQDNWLSAVRGTRLFKVRAKSLVAATGAVETPLLFGNNDLPGVMLGSGVQRLLHLYGVVIGRRAAIVTANDDGWAVAADLHAAGVSVAAVVDEREASASPHAEALASAGVPVFYGHTVLHARGSGAVRGAVIVRVGSDLPAQSLKCDLIAVSMGWTPDHGLVYMAGGKSDYDSDRAENLPVDLPPGVYEAGRAAGTHAVDTQIDEGRLAGANAAAYLSLGSAPKTGEISALARQKAAEPGRTSPRTLVPGKKKRFLCFCEDVTDQDLETSIAEGYTSIELLKRYSTISMGPCQGRMCSMNTIHLCARANGWTVRETGRTTSRPPVVPVTLGALAGQNMEPVQVTGVHDWHLARGAKMMVSGLWLRPEHYGDPAAEVQAVRERVGIIDVSTLGKLQLTGPGVPGLLERLYVNRWRKLGLGRVRYGAMCNDEGVVMDDGVCAHVREEEWYMSTTSSGATGVYEWIQWWMQSGWGGGVHAVDLTETYSAFNLAGPQARAVLQKLTDRDLSNQGFAYMRIRSARVASVPCRLLRIGFTGELSYEVHCPSGYALHLWEALMDAGEEFGISPFGMEAQRVLRLEKGHMIVGQDTDALTDPISADMEWAVKLDKRDFLGKRNLVRVSKEGPRRRLVGFKMARPGGVPEEGLQIVTPSPDGKLEIIGWVTSCRFSPTLKEVIGLCWLPADLAARNGAAFTIYMNESLEEARVHHGAFYDPRGERLKM